MVSAQKPSERTGTAVSDSVYSSWSLVQPFSTSAFLFTPFSSNPFALTFRSTAGTPWVTLGNSEGQGSSFSLLAVWNCGREALVVGDKPMLGAPNCGLSWLSCPCLSHSSWRLWRWRGLLSRRPVNSIHTFRFFTSCSEGCGHTSEISLALFAAMPLSSSPLVRLSPSLSSAVCMQSGWPWLCSKPNARFLPVAVPTDPSSSPFTSLALFSSARWECGTSAGGPHRWSTGTLLFAHVGVAPLCSSV